MLQSQNGTLVGDAGTGKLQRTCCCNKGPCIGADCPHICTSHNSCNLFCDSDFVAFYRAPQCDCPCGGNRDYPLAYDIRIDGVTLHKGPFATGNETFPTASVQMPDGSPVSFKWVCRWVEGNTCDCGAGGLGARDQTVVADAVYFNPDGSVGDYLSGVVSVFVGSFDLKLCDCADADPSKIKVVVEIIGEGLPPTLSFAPAYTFVSTINIDQSSNSEKCDQTADRCGSPPGNAKQLGTQQIFNGEGYGPWIDTPGQTVVTPTCRDCANLRLVSGTEKATVCAAEYDVTVSIADGTDGEFQEHDYKLFGGGTQWTGHDQFGCSGLVTSCNADPSDDTIKCCPTFNPNTDCTDCPDPHSDCQGCWRMVLVSTSGLYLTYFSQGDCQGANGWTRYSGDGVGGSTPEQIDAGGVSGSFVESCSGKSASCVCCIDGVEACEGVKSATVTFSGVTTCGCIDYPAHIDQEGAGCDTTYAKIVHGSVNGSYTVPIRIFPERWDFYTEGPGPVTSDYFGGSADCSVPATLEGVRFLDNSLIIQLVCMTNQFGEDPVWVLGAAIDENAGYQGATVLCIAGAGGALFVGYCEEGCVEGALHFTSVLNCTGSGGILAATGTATVTFNL